MQYSNYDMKNNVHATLSTAISSVATTIQLTAGQGARFGNTFPQIATLESFDENGKVVKREIVQITGRSTDNLTVVRAFAPCPENDDANSQSQNAISFNADDTISLYIPKEIFDIIKKSLNDIYDNGANNMRTEVVSGLQVEVNPGQVLVGSAYYDFAGGTITLTDNATNYLEVDEDGNLANNTSGRNDENTKLAIITTSGGSVTNIKDRRLGTVGGKIGGVNIHDLTEKISLSPDDEFIVADSEAIFQNKKIKASGILGIGNLYTSENISKGDILNVGGIPSQSNSTSISGFGFSNDVQKLSTLRIGNGVQINSIDLYLAKVGSPSSPITVRIESDNNGKPSGNLIHTNATGTVSSSSLTTTLTKITVNFGGNFTIPVGTICHIVVGTATINSSNFYQVGGQAGHFSMFPLLQYNGSTWNTFVNYISFINLSQITQTQQASSGYQARGAFLSRDGKHIATVIQGTQLSIRPLNTAWDLSTMGTATTKNGGFGNYGRCVWITEDGKKIFFSVYSGQNIYYGTLSTPRDASTLTGVGTIVTNTARSLISPQGLYFSPDGTKLYLTGQTSYVYEITLSTPRDLTTGTQTGKVNMSGATDVFMSDDGKTLYVGTSSYTVSSYTLGTAWTLSTLNSTPLATKSIGNYQDLGYITNQGGESYLFTSDVNSSKFYKWSASNPEGIELSIFSDAVGFEQNIIGKANAIDNIPFVSMSATNDFNMGELVKYRLDISQQENLDIGQKYYLSDTPGEIQTTPGTNEFEVGIAIEPTILKLKQTY